jgi:hypothetical protein
VKLLNSSCVRDLLLRLFQELGALDFTLAFARWFTTTGQTPWRNKRSRHAQGRCFFNNHEPLRLGPHERTNCVRCNALCDVRCRNRKKPIARHARTRMLGMIGFLLFLQRMSQSALQRTHFVRSCGPSLKVNPKQSAAPKFTQLFRLVQGNSYTDMQIQITQQCLRIELNSGLEVKWPKLVPSLSVWSMNKSELLNDWRFTASHFILATSPLRLTTSSFIFQLITCGYSPYVTSSITIGWVCRLQLLLALASAVILRSEPRSWPYFTLSDSRHP